MELHFQTWTLEVEICKRNCSNKMFYSLFLKLFKKMLQNECSLLSLLVTVHDCDYGSEAKSLTLWLSNGKLSKY